jgi:radical SAM protein with 4Fe4S-binding SPASM domain
MGIFPLNHMGELSPCQRFDSVQYGTMDTDGVLDSVLSAQAEPNIVTSGYQKSGCTDCMWRFSCAGYCSAITFGTYGTTNVALPLCQFYKAILPAAIKLEAKRILQQTNLSDYYI